MTVHKHSLEPTYLDTILKALPHTWGRIESSISSLQPQPPEVTQLALR